MGKKSEEVDTPGDKIQGWDVNNLSFLCTGRKDRCPVLQGQSQARQQLATFCQSVLHPACLINSHHHPMKHQLTSIGSISEDMSHSQFPPGATPTSTTDPLR